MKKIIPILLVLLALVFAFSACKQTESVQKLPRWNNEEYTFRISKADFTIAGQEYGSSDILSTADQLVPRKVSGTFKMKISVNEDKLCTFTTEQTLYCSYDATELSYMSQLSIDDLASVTVSNENGVITLVSKTETSVVFKNESAQRPVSSTYSYNGYYLGTRHQEVSSSTTKAEYDWGAKRLTVKINKDGEETTNKLKVTSNLIDSNQLLLFMRSLDKKDGSFPSTPSIRVYVASTNTMETVSFNCARTNSSVNISTGEPKGYEFDAVQALSGGRAILTQFSLPNLSEKDLPGSAKDISSFDNQLTSKFTQIRFRAGWFSYELDYSTVDEAILQALGL